jgi:pheromone shutdown-related protein TraB
MDVKRIRIIGTSHISKDSINEVKTAIKEFNPDIIALELDPIRFHALISKKQKRDIIKELKYLGIRGIILNTIGSWIEKKLGKRVNVSPGSEMRIAIRLAKKNKKEIALVDQDVRITIKKLTKEVKFKEKLRIFLDILKTPFGKKQLVKIDISKVPDQKMIDEILNKIKKRYPQIYRILIEERNKIIAKNLNKIRKERKNKRILAIIGAGHKKGVEELISNEFK